MDLAAPGQAAQAAGGEDRAPAGQRARAAASTCASSPRRTAARGRRCATAASAPTCTSACGVVQLELPPLRERGGDVVAARAALPASCSRALRQAAAALSREPRTRCCRHRWPGNVRELRNVMEQAVLLSVGETVGRRSRLARPTPLRAPAAGRRLRWRGGEAGRTLVDMEREPVMRALSQRGQRHARRADSESSATRCATGWRSTAWKARRGRPRAERPRAARLQAAASRASRERTNCRCIFSM